MFLLDTNIVSDAQKGVRKPMEWLATIDPMDAHLSVVTIGEMQKGITRLMVRNRERAAILAEWLDGLRRDNATRILPVTEEIALEWGKLAALRTHGDADGLIAATAIVHGFVLVTRNVADFADAGVPIVNPWDL